MSVQFGTNWSQFSALTGNIVSPLIGYEVLTAFFLEASFLGIMLFGWRRVGPRLHFFPTAIGLFLLSHLGLAISLWPYIIPRALTIGEAAAPYDTQIFMLVGGLIFLPLVLAYTVYVYRVFKGKAQPGEAHY